MEYTYFLLGIVLGMAIIIYFNEGRKERITEQLRESSKTFLTQKLNKALDVSIRMIMEQRKALKRDLTEEEKDEIIFGNYQKEKINCNAK